MRYVLVILMMGLAALSHAVMSHAVAPPASLETVIVSQMKAAGAPGMAYALVKNDAMHTDAHGQLLIHTAKPVTPDTPFRIGSISKSFTAMAVMQLVEAGKVKLDDPISNYLPRFSNGPSAVITIRQLLSHTSGFSTLQGNAPDTHASDNADDLPPLVDQLAQSTPDYPPGSQWDYSNANYMILGALVETISGLDFANYIETKILTPIGMTHSFVAYGDDHTTIAVGHQPWFGAKRPLQDHHTSRARAPAGGLFASASDLGLYMQLMMNAQDDVITAASKAMMMRPASDASPFYGLGWFIDTDDQTIYHSGVVPGTETLAVLIPSRREGVVVLVNGGSGMGFGETSQLLNTVSMTALGLDAPVNHGRWSRKALFAMFVLLPFLFVGATITAGLRRQGLRAKSGPVGAFSIWFPVAITLVLAWTAIDFIPRQFGVTIGVLNLYQPDLVLALAATGLSGVIWALFRLGVYYTGR